MSHTALLLTLLCNCVQYLANKYHPQIFLYATVLQVFMAIRFYAMLEISLHEKKLEFNWGCAVCPCVERHFAEHSLWFS